MNWIEMGTMVLFAAVCAMAGALVLMQRMAGICRTEARYDLPPGSANLIGAVVGGLAGLSIAGLCIYYYDFTQTAYGWIEWVGRVSYMLIIGASAGHLALLLHVWNRLDAETRDLNRSGKGPQSGTLLLYRRAALNDLKRSRESFADQRARDDEVVTDLVGVFGERLLVAARSLNRIPFYGYLGTVCGILMMAQELSHLSEASETFRVLRDMASGLVLAFRTTLIALLAYLPLRKAFDTLLARTAALERAWLSMREEVLGGDSGR